MGQGYWCFLSPGWALWGPEPRPCILWDEALLLNPQITAGPWLHLDQECLPKPRSFCAVEKIMLPQRQWFKPGKEKRWLLREPASTFCRVCTRAGPPELRLRHAGRAILHTSAGHSGTRLLFSRIKCIFRSLQILLLWTLHLTGVLFWKNSLRAVHGQLLSLCELNVMLCGF